MTNKALQTIVEDLLRRVDALEHAAEFADHAELMKVYESYGMTRMEASEKAHKELSQMQ